MLRKEKKFLKLPPDPDPHQNLVTSSLGYAPHSHKVSWKSVQYFLHNPANKHTNERRRGNNTATRWLPVCVTSQEQMHVYTRCIQLVVTRRVSDNTTHQPRGSGDNVALIRTDLTHTERYYPISVDPYPPEPLCGTGHRAEQADRGDSSTCFQSVIKIQSLWLTEETKWELFLGYSLSSGRVQLYLQPNSFITNKKPEHESDLMAFCFCFCFCLIHSFPRVSTTFHTNQNFILWWKMMGC